MNKLIWLAKGAMGFVWLVLLTNIFMPFPGKAAIALYILTLFLLFMHGIQLLIFLGAFGDKVSISAKEKWAILFFGIFELLAIRKRYMTTSHP